MLVLMCGDDIFAYLVPAVRGSISVATDARSRHTRDDETVALTNNGLKNQHKMASPIKRLLPSKKRMVKLK